MAAYLWGLFFYLIKMFCMFILATVHGAIDGIDVNIKPNMWQMPHLITTTFRPEGCDEARKAKVGKIFYN